jgi:hypothetical protein
MDESADLSRGGSLEGLFTILDGAYRSGTMPGRACLTPPDGTVAPDGAPPGETADGAAQPELFPGALSRPIRDGNPGGGRRGCPAGVRSFPPGGSAVLFPDLRGSVSAALLLELSADAFDSFVLAWMSELPVEGEMLRFGWKVLAAARAAAASTAAAGTVSGPACGAAASGPACGAAATDPAGKALAAGGLRAADASVSPAGTPSWAACPEARRGAERAASDRGDPDVRAVLDAAFKAGHETDRLRGLLRFAPVDGGAAGGCFGGGEGGGLYLARCFPDHYVLPALAEHFTRRFGAGGWAIVDERRGVALLRRPGGNPELVPAALFGPPGPAADGCEELWRHYHRTVNNESRNNPALQRRCMPERYWKYLPELR